MTLAENTLRFPMKSRQIAYVEAQIVNPPQIAKDRNPEMIRVAAIM